MGSEKSEPGQALRLDGSRILLVEDEYYIADDLQRILTAAGASVVGPCSTVAIAQDAVNQGAFDCAVVDLNLHGESALPIADQLVAKGRSFAIATGYGSPAVPAHLKAVPRIEKPFDPSALLNLVAQLSCARVR